MTSTALVPVFAGTLQNQSTQLCNARDLHAVLEVGRDFTTWLKERIEQYGFTDGEDFATFTAPPIRGAGNRGKRTDYHLTLDMAKELAMVENNDKGRAVRRYFIALEKNARVKIGTKPKALQAPTSELSSEVRRAINRKAHALTLEGFDHIRDSLFEFAEQFAKSGEPEEKILDRIARPPGLRGELHMVHGTDLWEITAFVACSVGLMQGVMKAIHRLEEHTGRKWYGR